jgi:hypothetical protein
MTLGLAHPTGFPLYILLGKLFTLILPIGDVAYRLNIFSALLTSIALVFFYLSLLQLDKSRTTSLLTTFILGFGANTIWGNSGRADVYTLSLFFVSFLFFIFSKWLKEPKVRYLYLYGFFWGISMGTHALMIIMSIPFIYMLWSMRSLLKSKVSVFFTAAALAVLPGIQYLYLIFAYRRDEIVTWGSMATFNDFLYYITQREYANKFLANNFGAFFLKLSTLLGTEFAIVFSLIAIVGFFFLYKKNRALTWILVLMMVINISIMFAYGKDADDLKVLFRYLFVVDFFLPIGIAFVLDEIFDWIGDGVVLKVIAVGVTLILLVVQFNFAYEANDRRNNFLIQDTAQDALNTLPPNSVIFALGDDVIGPLWYEQGIGKRPDVVIISSALIQYNWYVDNLIKRYPNVIDPSILNMPNVNDRILQLIKYNDSQRPIYSIMFNSVEGNTDYDFVPQGILFEILPKGSYNTKTLLLRDEQLWNSYTFRGVKYGEYSDVMLNDLTINYSGFLEITGMDLYNNGFKADSVVFLQRALDVSNLEGVQQNLEYAQANQ